MGRFKKLVESEEAMEKFIADYRIPSNVGLRYCKGSDSYNRLSKGGYEDPYGPNDEGLPQTLPTSAHLVCYQCV